MVYETGVECRRPYFRRIAWDRGDIINTAKVYKRIGGVHHTVWNYISTEVSESGRTRPDYGTAVFDKVYMESDDDSMAEIIAIRDFFRKNRYSVKYYFSGRGFYVVFPIYYEAGANKFNILYNIHEKFINDVDIDIHACIRGNFAQTRRMCNTYNAKRKRYCIWLNQADLDLGYRGIVMLAQQPRGNIKSHLESYSTVWNITEFDHEIPEASVRMALKGKVRIKDSAEDALDEYGLGLELLCPFFINMISSRKLGHEGRFWTVLFIKDKIMVPSATEARDLFYNCFDKMEFRRAIEEGQFQDVYRQKNDGSWRYKFSCNTLKKYGICPQNCKELV